MWLVAIAILCRLSFGRIYLSDDSLAISPRRIGAADWSLDVRIARMVRWRNSFFVVCVFMKPPSNLSCSECAGRVLVAILSPQRRIADGLRSASAHVLLKPTVAS